MLWWLRKKSRRQRGQLEKPLEKGFWGKPLSPRLKTNIAQVKELLGESPDVVIREFDLFWGQKVAAALVYIDGLTEKKLLNEALLKSLMFEAYQTKKPQRTGPRQTYLAVKRQALSIAEIKEAQDLEEAISGVLSGEVALFLEGIPQAILAGVRTWKERAITESPAETVIRGPRESFTENLATNLTLLRRRLKSPHLRFELLILGTQTQTRTCLGYLQNLANPEIVAEVRRRLSRIETDSVLDSAYIEEFIEDAPFSLFPTIAHTEKPDHIAAGLLEGRMAILVDGTPFVLSIPAVLFEFIQSPEDYYERYPIGTLIRWMRYLSFFVALFLPSFYIAVVTFHHEMLPDALLFNIAGNREGVPFPTFLEVLIMEGIFEVLREAGIRMPRALGQAISIVGALILGEAAIRAGLVSPGAVITVATTAIASFAVPVFAVAISLRILRFVFMILAGILGLFGIMFGALALLIHLVSLRSFGVPYFSPFAPLKKSELKDILVRVPRWAQKIRPPSLHPQDLQRQSPFLRSQPPKPGGGKKDA